MFARFANFLLLAAGWAAGFYGAGSGTPWMGPIVTALILSFHLRRLGEGVAEARLIAVVTLLGTVLETFHAAVGVVSYGRTQLVAWLCPLWVSGLWAILATTLRHSLRWLSSRPQLAALLGAILGPGAYAAGAEMGALSFPYSPALSLLALAMIWGGVLPLLLRLSTWLFGGREER